MRPAFSFSLALPAHSTAKPILGNPTVRFTIAAQVKAETCA
jgi:hypothetical protein